jgi:succinate dehydrogenase / fumarate reductase membrane anchor subunit
MNAMRVFQMQRISAMALLFFMTIHMVVVHYPPGHIDFSRIIERMADPLWKAIDIAFLFFVLMHALTGAYVILTDWQKVSNWRRALAVASIVVFVFAFVYGTATIIAFQPV